MCGDVRRQRRLQQQQQPPPPQRQAMHLPHLHSQGRGVRGREMRIFSYAARRGFRSYEQQIKEDAPRECGTRAARGARRKKTASTGSQDTRKLSGYFRTAQPEPPWLQDVLCLAVSRSPLSHRSRTALHRTPLPPKPEPADAATRVEISATCPLHVVPQLTRGFYIIRP